MAAVGEGWCFLLNGTSYVAVIAGLRLMDKAPIPRAVHIRASVLADIGDGFRFVGRTAPVRALLLLIGVVSVTAMPHSVLMPIFADQILHGGARGLGVLMGATGVGALAGAVALAARRSVHGLDSWVAWASFGFGAVLLLFSFSRDFWLSVGLLVPVGAMMMVQMAATNTLVQAMVPDRLRGRVMAVYSMMLMGMAPFGALFAGFIAARIGAPRTVALGGVACVAAAVVFGLRLRARRGEARTLLAAQELAAGEAHSPS